MIEKIQAKDVAKKLLLNALRQYCHNTGEGLLAGYDKKETEEIVSRLLICIKNLEKLCQEKRV